MSESYVLSFWHLGNIGLLWKSWEMKQGDTLLYSFTSISVLGSPIDASWRFQNLVSLKLSVHLSLEHLLGDAHVRLKTTDVNFYILIEFDKRDRSAQVRPWLRICTLVFTLWEYRTVACNTRDKTVNPSWLFQFFIDSCSHPFYSVLLYFFLSGNNF